MATPNHKPTITGTATGGIGEDAPGVASGQLTVTDSDPGESFAATVTNAAASYGTWSVDQSGLWNYQLNNSNAAVQALGAGATLKDNFTVTSLDGSATKAVTITISGTNDVPTITGTTTGSTTEDATANVTGTLVVTDPDAGQSATLHVAPTTTAYGLWSVDTAGHWTYKLDNTNATVQGLISGQTLTDSFTVTSVDGTAHQLVTVTINGVNDAANLVGANTGTVTEDGTLTATGLISVIDKDAGQSQATVIDNAAGKYGTFSITADGHWSYQLNNGNAAVQSLAAGAKLTDSFNVTSFDGGTTKTVGITITGTNDIPTFAGATTGTTAEDSPTSISGTLVVSDADAGQSSMRSAAATASTYGTWSVDSGGRWTYQVDNANSGVQALAAGQSLQDSFSVTGKDGTGSQTVAITINGRNDSATISGDATGTVTEGGTQTASGTVTVIDKDNGEAQPAVVTNQAATYGTWSTDAVGHWTYQLNNGNAAVQALGVGQSLQDGFTVTSKDGTASQVVTIAINGAFASTGGAATITGTTTGSTTEDATANVTGTLVVTDPDAGQSATQHVAPTATAYGLWSVDTAGHWTYKLDNTNATVQGLINGQTLTDSFTVTSADGTAHQLVTVTINGVNDAANLVGANTGTVTEDGTLTATGLLSVIDKDAGQSQAIAIDNAAGKYGTFSITADGHWSYQLNNGNAAVQSLAAGAKLTDNFNVTSFDGGTTKTVGITINGTNDTAIITGQTAGSVTETTALVAKGTLAVADVDTNQAHTRVESGNTTYGQWSVDVNGHWTYQLNANNPAVAALPIGQTLSDSFAVTSYDGGTAQTIAITINGSNHVATVTGDVTGTVNEDGTLATGGTLTFSDSDAGQSGAQSQALTVTASGYGQWQVDGGGHWSYQLANGNAAIQALGAGQSLSDSFTVTSLDGSAHQGVTVTINGANDAPTTPQDTNPSANVILDNVATGTPVGITLAATDIDTGATLTYLLNDNAGSRFAVDPSTGVVSVAAGATLAAGIYTITGAASDGIDQSPTQNFTITVNASNHAPVAQSSSASGNEDTVISGMLIVNDADGDTLTYGLAPGGAPAHGNAAINADGSFGYTPNGNYNGPDSFTYRVDDGHGGVATATVSLTVNPVNDPPSAPADADSSANVILDTAAAGTAVGITLQASDVDSAGLTYLLTDSAGGRFTVDATTGIVSVAAGAVLANGNYTITGAASDGQAQSATQDFAITVSGANQAPTLTLPADLSLLSTSAAGVKGTASSTSPVFAPDGSKVVFTSGAGNLVPGDTNGTSDIFVKDLKTGAITLVSTSAPGIEGNGLSSAPVFSPDGSKVAFSSYATNLVPGDTNSQPDIFVKDLNTGGITLISADATGVQGNNLSQTPVFSPDGGKIAFASFATNLVAGDTNKQYDIFVKDLGTGAVTLASASASGGQGNNGSNSPVFSPDGSKVAFTSDAGNLVSGDGNNASDVFVKDLNSGAITLVSANASGVTGNNSASSPVFSPDGSKVAFSSNDTTLVSGDTNGRFDIFVKDLNTGAVTLVSTSSAGVQGNNSSSLPVFSPDGSKILFVSTATNLVAGDTNGVADIFMKDLNTGALTLVATSDQIARFSPDGSAVIFGSTAKLLSSDTDGSYDIYLRDLYPGLKLASVANDPVVDPGTPVAALLGSAFGDADAGAQKGIAIVGLDLPAAAAEQPQGSWQFSTDSGAHWSALSAVSMSNAAVLSDTALVRFVPTGTWSGVAELKVLAWDQTDGHHSGDTGVNITATGGGTAYSSIAVDAVVSVMPAETGGSSLVGTTAGEILSGSKNADTIHGNDGNDVLFGNGGADHLFGDNGNDMIHVANTAYAEVHGGAGADTLAFDGANLAIDLHGLIDHTDGIEKIDLSGGNSSTLTLQAADVLGISDTGALAIFGGSTNIVNAPGEGWQAAGTQLLDGHTCNVFTAQVGAATATLLIDQHIGATVS